MHNESNWNLHSVIEVIPKTDADSRLTSALEIVSDHALNSLGHPIKDFAILQGLTVTPRAKLASIRELGERMKFVTIPFAYLDPAAYQEESEETKRIISVFESVFSANFHVYALCPIEYYSLTRHLEAGRDLSIMVPPEYVPVFQMLEVCIPVFRDIRKDISDLRQKLEMNIRAQQERERQRWLDPLMFAIPKASNLDSNGFAIIGPAWGPDLDGTLLEKFKFTIKPGQRTRIRESIYGMLHTSQDALLPAKSTGQVVNETILKSVTKGQPAEIQESVRRFLEGDYSVLNTLPKIGTAYSLNDITRVARIARFGVKYYERLCDRRS